MDFLDPALRPDPQTQQKKRHSCGLRAWMRDYSKYSYEYELLRAGFLVSRIATCKKNARKKGGGAKRTPFVDEAFFLHVAIIDPKKTSS